jgi:teichuronic acid biosynthesis glycosyltransferase TuaG
MEQTGASLSYTSYGKMLEDGTKTTRIVHVPPRVTYRQLLSHNVIGCLTAVYDTDQTGKRYMPEIKLRDDFALWLNILKAGHVARGIDEPLGYLRLRKGSLSSNKFSAAHQQWVFYRNVERLSLPRSTYHFLNYLVLSGLKHAR